MHFYMRGMKKATVSTFSYPGKKRMRKWKRVEITSAGKRRQKEDFSIRKIAHVTGNQVGTGRDWARKKIISCLCAKLRPCEETEDFPAERQRRKDFPAQGLAEGSWSWQQTSASHPAGCCYTREEGQPRHLGETQDALRSKQTRRAFLCHSSDSASDGSEGAKTSSLHSTPGALLHSRAASLPLHHQKAPKYVHTTGRELLL